MMSLCRSFAGFYLPGGQKIAFVVCLLSALAACSSSPKNTLGSLTVLDLKINKNVRIDSARDKAMDSYWAFMNSAPNDSLRVEALRRLADLELERSEDTYQRKLEKFNSSNQPFNAFDANKLKGVSYSKAIKLYEDAIALSESSGKLVDPQLFYQLSKAYEQTGHNDKAIVALNQLLFSYPDIENRDEVYFRRGELLFSQKKFSLADQSYSQVMVVGPSSVFYEKALSKRGWSAYKMGRYSKAIYSFFSLISRKVKDEGASLDATDKKLSRGDRDLLGDTLRVIALSFNELGGATAIDNYFNDNGHEPYEYRAYLALGELYTKQGRTRDAVSSYKRFSSRYPFSPKAAAFDIKAIDAVIAGGFSQMLIDEKIAFSKKYKVNGDYWSKQSETVRRELVPILVKNIEEIATHFHSISQQSKAPKDYVRAQNWYKHFLRSFKYSKRAQRMNFLLAESFFENKQYRLSAKEYEKTAYQYIKSGKDAEAGYAALVAYAKQADLLEGSEKGVLEQVAIASALRFGKTFQKDKRAPLVLVKVAEDFFAIEKFDQASSAARSVLELKTTISNKMRLTAWLIVAKASFQRKEYAKAESAYKVAKSLTKNSSQLANIQEGIAATLYKRGEKLRASGDMAAAAVQFKRVASVAPGSDINISATFDLAVAFMVDKKWQAAIEALSKFRRDNPNHRLEKQVSTNLATAYLQVGENLKAADEFEYLIHFERDPVKKRDMAWQVAQIYEGAGRMDKVVDMYEYYLLHFPEPLGPAQEARHKLANLYQQSGDDKAYTAQLQKIIRSNKFAQEQGSDRSQYLAANAALILAKPVLKMYSEVELKAPLKQNLKIKKRFMKAAVEAYTEVANYGVSNVTTAAYYSLAQIYNDFSQKLINSERPKGLSNDELEQYNLLIEEQAYPFEEKSIDIHQTNAALANNGTYDEWVRKSFAILKSLNPIRYAKPERSDLIAGIVQ